MAANAMFMSKPSVFNISKPFYPSATGGASSSLSFPRKVSMVRFTYAALGKEGTFSVDETINSVGDKVSDISGNAKDSILDQKANVEEGAGKLKDNLVDESNELTKNAKDGFQEGKENVTTGAQQLKDNATVNIDNLKEKTSEIVGKAADKIGETKESINEGAQKAGDTVSQSAQGAWDGAKEKTEKIKEAVVGKNGDA